MVDSKFDVSSAMGVNVKGGMYHLPHAHVGDGSALLPEELVERPLQVGRSAHSAYHGRGSHVTVRRSILV
ncbi:hypothetical protein OH76DRAFT_1411847, partial [Lentinus brumalis]